MAWYTTGTVNIASTSGGASAVTGVGTDFVAAGIKAGDALLYNNALYEVLANPASATSLSIRTSGFVGVTGVTYAIVPTQAIVRDLTGQVTALINDYSGAKTYFNEDGTAKVVDGTVADPSYAFSSDTDTGFYRIGSNAIGIAANGQKQAEINATDGIVVVDDKLTVVDGSDATKRARFETSGITTGTTRTFTLPNASTTLVGTDTTQTLTNKTLTSPTLTTPNIGAATGTSLSLSGNATFGGSTSADSHIINGVVDVNVNTATTAFTITQTGAGNAFVVEDSTSPDATPFVIDANGIVNIGVTGVVSSSLVVASTAEVLRGASRADLTLKRANTSLTSPSIVASGDSIGQLGFQGYDGAGYVTAAVFRAEVDGTPATNSMPGRLIFSTTLDGASIPTERYRINNAGNHFFGNTTTNTNSTLMVVNGEISETTSGVQYKLVNQSDIGTAPNEIPLNQYLGEMAYMNADQIVIHPVASVAPIGIGDMVFQLTNDTTLVIKVKGSDGVVRSNTLTLA